MEKFFELIQVNLGNKEGFLRLPSDDEWRELLELADRQSLASVLFMGIEKVFSQPQIPKPEAFYEWLGILQVTEAQNSKQKKRVKELTSIFSQQGGFCSCLLKGQGTALYYPHPEYRACGDIDFWVIDNTEKTESTETNRDSVLEFAKEKGYYIGHVDIKHSDIVFFEDFPVEVHFIPSWMYCPWTNKRLQKFFKEKAERQFSNFDEQLGFAHTTIDFDLVYSMVHIYRHIFSEGIGLRQLVDYYYILQHSTEEERHVAFDMLRCLKMASFVGGIMWILIERFGMDSKYALCPANVRHGEFLLSEIMMAGNLGQFDERNKRIDFNKRFKRGISQFEKNMRFVSYYPSEVLWSPIWKFWHWGWRKWKGYL